MTYIERIVDANTGETIERAYTKAQLDEVKANQLKEAEINAELATKASDKAALLAKLGITDDEAKLLLS
jgi:hypothetical protein